MSVKNNIFLSLVAVVALCSCESHDDGVTPDGQTVIMFGRPAVTSGGFGRSRSGMLNAFPSGAQFKVYGYCIPYMATGTQPDPNGAKSPWVDKALLAHADVFYGKTVTVNGDVTDYFGLKAWYSEADYPGSSRFLYSFMAHYPAEGYFDVTPASDTGKGAPSFRFTMPFSGGDNNTLLKTENVPDAMVASRFDHRRAGGKVNFVFSHIMTALRFRINNHNSEPLVITGARMSGRFYRTATFDFSTDEMKTSVGKLGDNDDCYRGYFNLLEGTQTVTGNGSDMLGTGDGTTVLLIPNTNVDPSSTGGNQYAIGDDKVITVNYRLGDGEPKEFSVSGFKFSHRPDGGKRYTVSLNFVGEKFVLVFTADNDHNWENGSDNDLTIK